MSLDWNVEAVPEDVRTIVAEDSSATYGYKAGDRIMNPVTHVLILSTIGVGIGFIDDDTIPEFAARLDLLQTLDGPFLRDGEGNGVRITREDIEAHKGLSTNVFPTERRAAWVKRHVTNGDPFRGVKEPSFPKGPGRTRR